MVPAAPQQPNDPRVPSNPPTAQDLFNAVEFEEEDSEGDDTECPADVGRAMRHKHALQLNVATGVGAGASAVAPPAWFLPIQQKLDVIQAQLRRLEAVIIKAGNGGKGEGLVHPYQIVPFLDGSDPTAQPHNLPPLRSAADINTLSHNDCRHYLSGYGVQNIPDLLDLRRLLVKAAIGCCRYRSE